MKEELYNKALYRFFAWGMLSGAFLFAVAAQMLGAAMVLMIPWVVVTLLCLRISTRIDRSKE